MNYSPNVNILRKIIIAIDDLMHFFVALILLLCVALVLFRAATHLPDAELTGILHTVNDVLLALIFLEILWPVVRFLRRSPFRLNPFLYVGIMSSTRRILIIEAEHSVMSRAAVGEFNGLNWQVPLELGVNVVVILILAVALKLIGEKPDEGGGH
ncbi:hypothetical protein EPN96_03330 [bacterium]|nr:MAG: hypothetical protein EPN96_03330 [bacterium]